MRPDISRLRADAIRRTLFRPTLLASAIRRLGFVQADPIRSPARAQDLILRHRVVDYRAGDLEQRYPKLEIEEDFLYAYGFLPRENWRLLHPRITAGLSPLEERVLSIARQEKLLHPRELEVHLGRDRSMNAWGGYSKATTRALHQLHYRGLLRIAGRASGIRLYAPTRPFEEHPSPTERLKQIVLLLARIFSPVPQTSLREVLRFLAHAAPGLDGRFHALDGLVRSGELETAEIDGLHYVWPAASFRAAKPPDQVQFLAPFDPLVWDRRRFEHLWGWAYRFEAYTPAAKRSRGYYTMPLLWRDAIIGWANVSTRAKGVDFKLGFVSQRPKTTGFKQALEAEIERFRLFLTPRSSVLDTALTGPTIPRRPI